MRDWTNSVEEIAGKHSSVRISDVTYSLGGRVVLSGLSLEIREKRVGIVGRNGSGKSTLARIIAGLLSPDRGRVVINNVDVASDRRGALQTVGILFQNPDHQIIFPTVEEEIVFGLIQLGQPKDVARGKARSILQKFNCSHWSNLPVSDLSQGQRHLVCLMAVLAMRPAVLLLDEPFSGLDIPTTNALHWHLDGIEPAVIQITHDPDALRNYDRVIWLDDGKVKKDGLATEVLHDYLSAMNAEGSADACADLTD